MLRVSNCRACQFLGSVTLREAPISQYIFVAVNEAFPGCYREFSCADVIPPARAREISNRVRYDGTSKQRARPSSLVKPRRLAVATAGAM